MDQETLLTLLMIAAFFVLRAVSRLGKRSGQARRAPQQRPLPEARREAAPPMNDVLREIEDLLNNRGSLPPAAERAPTPRPAPPAAPRPSGLGPNPALQTRKPASKPAPAKTRLDEFHAAGRMKTEGAFSEAPRPEWTDRPRQGGDEFRAPTVDLAQELDKQLAAAAPAQNAQSRATDLFKSSGSLRKAVLLGEILGPPKSRARR